MLNVKNGNFETFERTNVTIIDHLVYEAISRPFSPTSVRSAIFKNDTNDHLYSIIVSFLNHIRLSYPLLYPHSQPPPRRHCNTKRANIHNKQRNQHPPPSNHIRDFPLNLTALPVIS